MKHVFSIAILSLVATACDRSRHDADTTSAAAERAEATRDDANALTGDESPAPNDTARERTGYGNDVATTAAPASPTASVYDSSSGGAGAVARTGMGGHGGHGQAGQAGQAATATRSAPDNTGVNERDQNPSAGLTPVDQGTSEADRTITQRVRQGIVGREDLSMTAENVKIITVNGIVTLRGPVKTSEEKSTIDKIARQVSGVKRVDNQLEIAGR